MLDHLAFDDDTAPCFHYTIVDPHPLVQAYADAIDRMIGALMGTEPAVVRTDTKPAVAGLLSETPAGRYRGIGWCDATEAPPSPAPKPARRSFEVCQVLIPNMRVPIVIEDRPFSGHASPTDDSFADE